MKSSLLVCIFFVAIKNSHAAPQTSFLDAYIAPFRLLRSTLHGTLLEKQERPSHSRALRMNRKLQDKVNADMPFPCPLNNTKSDRVPNSVHELRPGDINVIGAMGDSLTAGFGLMSNNFLETFVENRGSSFSAGGEGTWREALTLPNILKVFNPNLIGYSLRSSLSIERASQFNVAEGGAISDNMPYMAKILVKRIKNDRRVNLEKDWKMINIMIGANDFCSEVCYVHQPEQSLSKHKLDMLEVLRTLRDNLPRTFVNLIPPPNVEEVAKFRGLPDECRIPLTINCPCAVGLPHQKFRKSLADLILRWQELDSDIARYEEFDREDFQVVAQPLFVDYSPLTREDGSTDYSYFAAECFHFSQKGSAIVANALWNNLMQPVGRKTRLSNTLFEPFVCPNSEFPYMFTNKNSYQFRQD